MPKQLVFISYSHVDADRDWVRAFVGALRDRGVNVWYDEVEVTVGEALGEAIEKGLRSSDTFVFLMTPESVTRPNVFFEIGVAIGMSKRIVAVVSRDVDLALLPQPLRTRVFLRQASPEETAQELVDRTPTLRAAKKPPGARKAKRRRSKAGSAGSAT